MDDNEAGFVDRGDSEGYFAVRWSPAAADFLEKHKFKKLEFAGAWGDFGFIAKYADFIESLLLANRDHSADGVAALHNLRKLFVIAKPKKPIDFSGLQKLEECSVPWHASYASTLFALPKLRSIRIESFAEADFSGISANSSIEKLTLLRPRIENLNKLGAFKNLKELDLSDASKLSSFAGIEQLKKLTRIRVINAKKLSHIPSLGALQELEALILGDVSLENLEFSYDMKRLATFFVGGEPVEVDWTNVLRLPCLAHIQIAVGKERCPTEEQIREMLVESGRKINELKLYSTRKSNWVSVQIKCTVPSPQT